MFRSAAGAILLLFTIPTDWPRRQEAFLLAESAELKQMRRQAEELYHNGLFREAASRYEAASQKAVTENAWHSAVESLNGLGTVRQAMLQSQEALHAYLEAKRIAELQGYTAHIGFVYANLASLYFQIGDLDSSQRSAEAGLEHLSGGEDLNSKSQLLTHLGRLCAQRQQLREAYGYFNDAILAADRGGDTSALAKAWEALGEVSLQAGQLKQAERALLEAYRLRLLFRDAELHRSYVELSQLRLAQGDLRSAAVLIHRARTIQSKDAGPALWSELDQLGKVRLAEGDIASAATAFRQAWYVTQDWRNEVLPTDLSPNSSSAEIHSIHRSYIEASLALRPPLVAEAFLAAEDDRADTLRLEMAVSKSWRTHLPHQYWDTLAQLRDVETKLVAKDSAALEGEAQRLRYGMVQLEIESGLLPAAALGGRKEEKSSVQKTLLKIQRQLSPEEALLSLYVGERSYLWALTSNSLEFHRLPDPKQLTASARQFRAAVEFNSADRDDLGSALYKDLFGGLSARIEEKSHWLITADEAFFDLPFAALVAEKKEGSSMYLVEAHSTQRVPSALLMPLPSERAATTAFLGIGDGIYNTADARWRSRNRANHPELGDTPLQMARIPGTSRELEASANEWRSSQPPVLLRGWTANREAFETALKDRPQVVHIAAHFLQPKDKPERALIDLGLSESGGPEVLTQEDILNIRVPGSTVVMSGCSSGAAQSLPGVGVLGLIRAWLIAGASAVIGSRWPTPDDTGELFQSFYRDLRIRCDRGAEGRVIGASLQQAQLEMLHSHTWRSNPSYWSAFFVVGKE